MSAFTGKWYKGAMRDRRKTKRAEAEARDLVSDHSVVGRKKRLSDCQKEESHE